MNIYRECMEGRFGSSVWREGVNVGCGVGELGGGMGILEY